MRYFSCFSVYKGGRWVGGFNDRRTSPGVVTRPAVLIFNGPETYHFTVILSRVRVNSHFCHSLKTNNLTPHERFTESFALGQVRAHTRRRESFVIARTRR